MTPSESNQSTTLFHSLSFADAPAMLRWLEAVGFRKVAVHTEDDHPEVVVHAQYSWGERGGIMFGSRRSDRHGEQPGDGWVDATGTGQAYCVVDTDAEVDAAYDRAMAAGATSVRAPEDQGYGGRGATVRDPEGNQWSFGSYRGE
jgi:uncharacterized glyoxalase superfamily protein PhnB